MEKGRIALLALLGDIALMAGAAGCASAPPPAAVVAASSNEIRVAETRTTGAVMLGAPVTMADGPRTTIPSETAR